MKASRPVALAAWSLVALGIILRLRQYLANRSLWLDEAMLALNIIHKDFGELVGKLDYEQGAPLGFILLEKLAATLIGDGERALRLLPLLAGCASLVLFSFLPNTFSIPPACSPPWPSSPSALRSFTTLQKSNNTPLMSS